MNMKNKDENNYRFLTHGDSNVDKKIMYLNYISISVSNANKETSLSLLKTN